MRKTLKLLLAAAVLLCPTVWAAPSYLTSGLMTWDRGDSGSTWQEWTFDTDANPAIPEHYDNPYGTPEARFSGTDGSTPFGWKPVWYGRDGVWGAHELFSEFYIPNSPDTDNPYKIIWFEMEYQAVWITSQPTVLVAEGFEVEQFYYTNTAGENYWNTMTIGWKIWPGPGEETIAFSLWGTGGFVNTVSIDTFYVVPAPAALPLVGLGLLVIGRLRQNKTL